jgi:hypothetical protein
MNDIQDRPITIAFPFINATEVDVDNSFTIGSIHQVDVTRLVSDTLEPLVWVQFEGIDYTHAVKSSPPFSTTHSKDRYPIPPDSDANFVISQFRERDGTMRNHVHFKFYDNDGDPITHTGCLYLTLWISESV